MPASYKDRLANFEVQPPKVAWHIISEELEKDSELLPVSEKLFDYEATPPVNTWKTIADSLEAGKLVLKKLPDTESRRRSVYSLAAAASILAAIALSIVYYHQFNITKSSFATIQTKKTIQDNFSLQEPAIDPAPLADDPETADTKDAVVETAPRARKDFEDAGKVLQTTTVKNPLLLENKPGINIAAKPIRNARGEIIQNNDITTNVNDQYISITSPNGQQTKISSKFQQMLSFLNDDNDEDEVDGYFDKNFLESLIWKSRFQEWRNKIINTSFVPSSTNFMDILEFRDLILKDK